MDNATLRTAVVGDRDGALKPVLDASYSLEPLDEFAIVGIAHDTNKNLGYELFDDLYYPRLLLDFSRVSRAVQINAYDSLKATSGSLKNLIDHQIRNGLNEQTNIYENTVMTAIMNGDSDDISRAYHDYQERLNHFDIGAFRKTIDRIVTEVKANDPEAFAQWAYDFTSIADYANERNNFDQKRKEILSMDGNQAEKQAIFDTLDRRRTAAHNRLIALFNKMNHFAEENRIPKPYPNVCDYEPSNPDHREMVAQVLMTQEPLLDTVNKFMAVERALIGVQSETEKLRSMSLTELLKYAAERKGISLDQHLGELQARTELNN